ncbi:AraC family transcriptional regulator [Kineothrix sp. MB12-C1]|uniref:AraC family transcriptional regulator n=1 Tax=Kineothrix sp. MB12-C1 TaxID=3070215 RepID=UPI0027D2C922|nr:helix-turn-helix domain-containing protein [Kineothrix sp. MB12-C1]WMC91795.1 helix-turn-helix domain-containing protein [Kineothrix sp. MB12-C1]
MALQQCMLNLDSTGRELSPHGTIDFPCAAYSHHCISPWDEIPWHYHEEIEIIYIAEGTMKVQIPGKAFKVREGEAAFINSGILHRAVADPRCEYRSLVFSDMLITGSKNSIFAQKYIEPILHYSHLDGSQLVKEGNWQEELIEHVTEAFGAMAKGEFGYEFRVRERLSMFCALLYRRYEEEINRNNPETNQDAIRIRKMLDFIHEHYAENLQLGQIAQTADIGERECLRCFQRVIQVSPIQYLLKYRVRQGASMLQYSSHLGIAEISILCGFDSPSNFSKVFKRFFSCTPKEYRSNMVEEK